MSYYYRECVCGSWFRTENEEQRKCTDCTELDDILEEKHEEEN